MKKMVLFFCILFTFLTCNKDDDKPIPIVEEEPDLSFPDCLLNNDIFEYNIIMSYEPSEPRGQIVKNIYQGEALFSFNQHILHDYNLVFYNNNCSKICVIVWNAPGTDCSDDFWNNREQIGVVWTDPR